MVVLSGPWGGQELGLEGGRGQWLRSDPKLKRIPIGIAAAASPPLELTAHFLSHSVTNRYRASLTRRSISAALPWLFALAGGFPRPPPVPVPVAVAVAVLVVPVPVLKLRPQVAKSRVAASLVASKYLWFVEGGWV